VSRAEISRGTLAFYLEGTLEPSPEEARCGLTCCLAALIEADCGLA
jgi:hypothetical protein